MVKLFNYAGTKINFIDKINPEINKSNKTIYVEPFAGSAAVFFNLEKKFDEYILNDLDRNVIRIFKSFKESTYAKLIECKETVYDSFGDIKNDKDAYYNFRNTFNSTYWNSDETVEGFYLYILYGSCINSMARFGPNGFNQSFGKREPKMDEVKFNQIHAKLQKTTLYNLDFFELLNKIEDKECLMFLDPPYIEREVSYKTISTDFFNNFIVFCKTTKNNILYTDTDHDFLDFEKIILRESMRNISPNRKEEFTVPEIMFKNY